MKLTMKQYLKAVEALPELRRAEETIKAWNDAIQDLTGRGAVAPNAEVLEIDTDDMSFKSKPKEKEPSDAPVARSA